MFDTLTVFVFLPFSCRLAAAFVKWITQLQLLDNWLGISHENSLIYKGKCKFFRLKNKPRLSCDVAFWLNVLDIILLEVCGLLFDFPKLSCKKKKKKKTPPSSCFTAGERSFMLIFGFLKTFCCALW